MLPRRRSRRADCHQSPGERILEKKQAEDLYRAFGRTFRTLEAGWSAFVLSSHTEFERAFGRPADRRRKLYNGMIKCDLFQYLPQKTGGKGAGR